MSCPGYRWTAQAWTETQPDPHDGSTIPSAKADAPKATIRIVSRPMTPEREAALHRFWTAMVRKFDGPPVRDKPAD